MLDTSYPGTIGSPISTRWGEELNGGEFGQALQHLDIIEATQRARETRIQILVFQMGSGDLLVTVHDSIIKQLQCLLLDHPAVCLSTCATTLSLRMYHVLGLVSLLETGAENGQQSVIHPLRPPVEVLWMIPNKEAVKALARRISNCLDADKAPDDQIELCENKYALQAIDSWWW